MPGAIGETLLHIATGVQFDTNDYFLFSGNKFAAGRGYSASYNLDESGTFRVIGPLISFSGSSQSTETTGQILSGIQSLGSYAGNLNITGGPVLIYGGFAESQGTEQRGGQVRVFGGSANAAVGGGGQSYGGDIILSGGTGSVSGGTVHIYGGDATTTDGSVFIGTTTTNHVDLLNGTIKVSGSKVGVLMIPAYELDVNGTIHATNYTGTNISGANISAGVLKFDQGTGNDLSGELIIAGTGLGVGVNLPERMVHIKPSDATLQNFDPSAYAPLFIENDDHTYIQMKSKSGTSQGIIFGHNHLNAYGYMVFNNNSNPSGLRFVTTGAVGMQIDKNQNVSIGADFLPSVDLHVADDTIIGGDLTVSGTTNLTGNVTILADLEIKDDLTVLGDTILSGQTTIYQPLVATGTYIELSGINPYIQFTDTSASEDDFRISVNTNELKVYNSTDSFTGITIKDATIFLANTGMLVAENGISGTYHSGTYLIITEQASITGKVGIGTPFPGTVPSGLLHISGNTADETLFLVEGSAGEIFRLNDSLTGTIVSFSDLSYPIFVLQESGRTTLGPIWRNTYIDESGKVGFGTTSPQAWVQITGDDPTYPLMIVGTGATPTLYVSGQKVGMNTGVMAQWATLHVNGNILCDNISGNITATGTLTGDIIRARSGIFSDMVSGAIVTGNSIRGTAITGTTIAGITYITGLAYTGSTIAANNYITGLAITGNTVAALTSLTGLNITGYRIVALNYLSGASVTGNIFSGTTFQGGNITATTITGTSITGTTISGAAIIGVGISGTIVSGATVQGGNIVSPGYITGLAITGNRIGAVSTLTGLAITGQTIAGLTYITGLAITGNTIAALISLTGLDITGNRVVALNFLSGASITGNTGSGTLIVAGTGLGIGINLPVEKLHVIGNSILGGWALASGDIIQSNATWNYTGDLLTSTLVAKSQTERFYGIASGGTIEIGDLGDDTVDGTNDYLNIIPADNQVALGNSTYGEFFVVTGSTRFQTGVVIAGNLTVSGDFITVDEITVTGTGLHLSGLSPTITFTDITASEDDFIIKVDGDSIQITDITDSLTGLGIDTSNNIGIANKKIYYQASDGYVGINTIAPATQLEVNGNFKAGAMTGTTMAATTYITGLSITGNTIGALTSLTGLNVTGNRIVALGYLSGASITGNIISGTTFQGGNIAATVITGTSITGTTISGATIIGVGISGTIVSGASIKGGNLIATIITGTSITGTIISGATFQGGNIAASIITGTSITGTTISGAAFKGGYFTGTQISGNRLSIDGNIIATGKLGIGFAQTVTDVSGLVHISGSTSGQTLLKIEGTNGIRLFVNDISTGVVFNVNDGSELPAIQVYDSGSVELGPYGYSTYWDGFGKVGILTGTPTFELTVNGDISGRNIYGSLTVPSTGSISGDLIRAKSGLFTMLVSGGNFTGTGFSGVYGIFGGFTGANISGAVYTGGTIAATTYITGLSITGNRIGAVSTLTGLAITGNTIAALTSLTGLDITGNRVVARNFLSGASITGNSFSGTIGVIATGLGIGINLPERMLHVKAGAASNQDFTSSAWSHILIEDDNHTYIGFKPQSGSGAGLLFGHDDSESHGSIIYNDSSFNPSGIRFTTNGNIALHIDKNQNVSIGANFLPSVDLHVADDTIIGGDLTVSGTSNFTGNVTILNDLEVKGTTVIHDIVTITGQDLYLSGDTPSIYLVDTTATSDDFEVSIDASKLWIKNTTDSFTGILIDGDSHVGVNCISPSTTLDVSGQVTAGSGRFNTGVILVASDDFTKLFLLRCNKSGILFTEALS